MQEYKDKVPQTVVDAVTGEVANVRALGDDASVEDIKGAVGKLQVCPVSAWHCQELGAGSVGNLKGTVSSRKLCAPSRLPLPVSCSSGYGAWRH